MCQMLQNFNLYIQIYPNCIFLTLDVELHKRLSLTQCIYVYASMVLNCQEVCNVYGLHSGI